MIQDTSGAMDAAAINKALSAGQAVQLVPGIYYINAPIEYMQNAVIRGAGKSGLGIFSQTTIRATTAMDAMLCSYGWLGGSNTAAASVPAASP